MRVSRISLIVLGAAGRMGSKVVEHIKKSPDCVLAGAFDIARGRGVQAPGRLKAALKKADAAIDFTAPAASAAYARVCAELKKPLVIGTTGFNGNQTEDIKKLSKTVPIFLSPNMSPAVNLTFAVARFMARKLAGFDIHISETHHRLKKDAPSGTALGYLARIKEVHAGPVSVTSARAGDIVGEHTVLYAGPCESVTLIHRAHARDVFARGAVKAALWLTAQKPGLYDYSDLLGLKEAGERL